MEISWTPIREATDQLLSFFDNLVGILLLNDERQMIAVLDDPVAPMREPFCELSMFGLRLPDEMLLTCGHRPAGAEDDDFEVRRKGRGFGLGDGSIHCPKFGPEPGKMRTRSISGDELFTRLIRHALANDSRLNRPTVVAGDAPSAANGSPLAHLEVA